jgi:hypothetical protein
MPFSSGRGALPFAAGLLLFLQLSAQASIIDFETFPDSTPIIDSTSITTQFPGLTFTDTTVISAGIGLNELEFPPHSGINAAFDDGGPISIAFASPISSFSGYFTYDEPLTLAAFDASDDPVATATSLFSSNDALYGDPGSSPNEFLVVTFIAGISSVTITGDPAGSSFVMDDISFTSAVPEPNSILLTLTGLIWLFLSTIFRFNINPKTQYHYNVEVFHWYRVICCRRHLRSLVPADLGDVREPPSRPDNAHDFQPVIQFFSLSGIQRQPTTSKTVQ